jgi:hypothetical protein
MNAPIVAVIVFAVGDIVEGQSGVMGSKVDMMAGRRGGAAVVVIVVTTATSAASAASAASTWEIRVGVVI